MSRLRAWPARFPTGLRPIMKRYPLKAAETFKNGDIVLLSGGEIEEAGTNPTTILGFSAQVAEEVVESGFVIVWVADENTEFAIQAIDGGDSNAEVAPDPDNIGSTFGVTKVGGVWCLDVDKSAANQRLFVTGVDEINELYFVKVLSANRQFDA